MLNMPIRLLRRARTPATATAARAGRRWIALSALLLSVWTLAPAAAQRPASTNFVLSQSTVNSGGANAVSSSFVLDGTTSQETTVGEAASTSFVLQSGFWTSLSTLDVLHVAASGSGQGSAAATGITCTLDGGAATGDCVEKVMYGTEISLLAAPDPANRFDGWSGCDATSTTTLPGDTCQVKLNQSRTVTAGLTLLGTVGDRVWRDFDGDGVQDAGEPGIDGVDVTLEDTGGGSAFSAATTTAGGGAYQFVDVPPDTYTLSVDPASLPPGVLPSFDPDGTATPHTASLSLSDGEDVTDADFGYQPMADLAITKQASSKTLPPDGHLVYTVTVQNLGPADATDVVATDVLAAGLTLVQTAGCLEDPAGAPACSLGDLAPGTSASYTIEVSADPTTQKSTLNTATVVANEVDPTSSNDAATVGFDPTPIVEIPTAGLWGLALLALLLAGAATLKISGA